MDNETRVGSTHSNSSTTTQPSPLSETEKVIIDLLLIIFALLGILGNTVVVSAIVRFSSYADVPANIFTLSLAIGDLLAAGSIPVYIYHLHKSNFIVSLICLVFVGHATLGSLFLLTFNRFVSVLSPFNYPQKMTPFRARLMVVVVWCIAVIASMIQAVSHEYPNKKVLILERIYMLATIISILFFNCSMFRQSRTQAQKVKTLNYIATGQQESLKEEFKSARTLAVITGAFLITRLPSAVVIMMYGNHKEGYLFQRYFAFTMPSMALKQFLDPVIYYFRSPNFRLFYQRMKRLYRARTFSV